MGGRTFERIKAFALALRPIQRLTVSEWSDKYRRLSSSASSEPGPWKTSRTPYLREIMDKLSSFDEVQEVVVMKAAQLGLTEMGFNLMGYVIDIDPGPMMYVLPTVDMVKRNSKSRFAPMIEATEPLRKKIKPARSRDSGNTLTQKDYPGGTLIMAGANSAAPLRNAPIKTLILDEIDAFPLNLDEEGSPIDLAKARTRTFSRRKIFQLSTPTVEGQSVINDLFKATDQRYFFVPCVECGEYQTLKFSQLKWEKKKYNEIRYQCEHCDVLIEERFKTRMLQHGEWRATVLENSNPKVVGYHINSLYSPFGWRGWGEIAEDFDKAQGNVNKLRTFVNTDLAETWKEKGDAPPWENLKNRSLANPYPQNQPNNNVALITVGVDIQGDRIELEIVGWCKNKVTYSIDYRVLRGDTQKPDVWNELAKVVNETWNRPDGTVLPMRIMTIDTGYRDTNVYEFCRRFQPTQVVPIRGRHKQATIVSPPKTIDVTINGKKGGKIKLWSVGVSILKSELYGWLKLELDRDEENNISTIPMGYCYFPDYGDNFFKGITAEQQEFKVHRGYREYYWVKKFERNEPLDCRIYARAGAVILGIDRFNDNHWKTLIDGYERKTVENKQQGRTPIKKRKSDYWGD